MYLPAGTSLNHRYIIETVLGQGGFGITYAAYDQTVGGRVAIKEYLPLHLATRAEGRPTVVVFTGEARQHFAYGLHKFMEEAQLLKQFAHHANIVSARDFFEAHGTAYMVMEYVEGVTLKEYLEKKGGRISFAEAAGIMMPVMDALREVHQVGLLHRDISPDNIYITTTAQVRVIDFGAARYFAGEQSKSLSVILKPGYAPEEQYHSRGKQGAWTDIYATAATLYRAITGVTPPEALDRREKETLTPPSRLGVEIPPAAEQALLKALAVRAAQRFQSMGEFQQALMDRQSPDTGLKPAVRPEPKTTKSYDQTSTPKPVPGQALSRLQSPVPVRRTRNPVVFNAAIVGGAIGLILIAGLIVAIYSWQSAKSSDPTNETKSMGPAPQLTAQDYFKKAKLSKNLDEKILFYTKAIELDPNNAMAYNNRGIAYCEKNEFDLALYDYNKAIAIKPNFAYAINLRGRIYYGKKDYEQALTCFNKAIKLKPDLYYAYYNRGKIYYERHDYDQALIDYNKAIELKGDYSNAFNDRGHVFMRKKDYDQAINDYNKAVILYPSNGILYSNRGIAFFHKGDFDQALHDYNKAISLKPENANTYYWRAILYNKKGEYEKSQADYDKAKSLNPGLPDLKIRNGQ